MTAAASGPCPNTSPTMTPHLPPGRLSSRAETTGRCPTDAEIAARYVKIRPYLDERQRRLWLVARATWTDVKTVRRGRDEVEAGLEPDGRVRGPGGGRPSVAGLDAGMLNGGTEWAPAGQPERVSVHGFPDEELGTVTPYGIYDLTANTGWVNVGTDHDTGALAAASIRSFSARTISIE
jgi:hypothetical protein